MRELSSKKEIIIPHPLAPFLAQYGDVIGLVLLVVLFIAFALERLPQMA